MNNSGATYIIQIKTGPEGQWFTPGGWGPYPTRAAAADAAKRAARLWMAVRVVRV